MYIVLNYFPTHRFQLVQHLRLHPLVKEVLLHALNHILNHVLVHLNLKERKQILNLAFYI